MKERKELLRVTNGNAVITFLADGTVLRNESVIAKEFDLTAIEQMRADFIAKGWKVIV